MKKILTLTLLVLAVAFILTGCRNQKPVNKNFESTQVFNQIEKEKYDKVKNGLGPAEDITPEIWCDRIKETVTDAGYTVTDDFIKIIRKSPEAYVTYFFSTNENEYYFVNIGDYNAGNEMGAFENFPDNWHEVEFEVNEKEKRIDILVHIKTKFLITESEYDSLYDQIEEVFETEEFKAQCRNKIPENIQEDFVISTDEGTYYVGKSAYNCIKINLLGFETAKNDGNDDIVFREDTLFVNYDFK